MLRQEVAALRREVARTRRLRRSRVGRTRLVAALSVALLAGLVPLGLLAVTSFTDLTGGVHDANP